MPQQISTNTFGCAKWIVSADATQGTHTTIATALTSASSGDTIFIRPGTYTENPTLKAGVNLTAFTCDDDTPNVTISGKCTFTAAGSVSISNIRLQTNSDFAIAVTGSAASILNLEDCTINATNNTAISYTSSSSSSQINVFYCNGDIGTTGISAFTCSSAGSLLFRYTRITNTGSSTTASTASAGTLTLRYCLINFPITTSGTASHDSIGCSYIASNTTCLTVGGSGNGNSQGDALGSGTASAISVGSVLGLSNASINSSNTNAITGAGTLSYSSVTFIGSSSKINTTTLTAYNTSMGSISFDGGTNLLSAYSTSTWTPVLSFGGASVGITYATQVGRYTRIGNICYVTFKIALSSKGSSTGSSSIAGLPFPMITDTGNGPQLATRWEVLTLTALYTSVGASVNSGASTIQPLQYGSTQSAAALADTAWANNSTFSGSGIYFVA